jgi:hypothetical protein
MKLKLIQSGGFTGRSKFAEEDLSLYPGQLQSELDEHLASFQKNNGRSEKSSGRDVYKYYVEYKGVRFPVEEALFKSLQFSTLLNKLITQLHY